MINWIHYLLPGSLFLAFLIGVIRYQKLTRELKVISGYLAFSVLAEAVVVIMAWNNINNLPLSHLVTTVEFLFFSWFYYLSFHRDDFIKKFIRLTVILFPVFVLLNGLFWQGWWSYSSFPRVLEGLLLLYYVIRTLYIPYEKFPVSTEETDSHFWVMLGLLFYFPGNLLLFLLTNYLNLHSPEHFSAIWLIHTFSNTVFNICLGLAVIFSPLPKEAPSLPFAFRSKHKK